MIENNINQETLFNEPTFFWVSKELIESQDKALQEQFSLIKKLGADTPEYTERQNKELIEVGKQLAITLRG